MFTQILSSKIFVQTISTAKDSCRSDAKKKKKKKQQQQQQQTIRPEGEFSSPSPIANVSFGQSSLGDSFSGPETRNNYEFQDR